MSATRLHAKGLALVMLLSLVSCVTTPDGDQDGEQQLKPIDLIGITDLDDRVRVELEAGGPVTYSLSTTEAPPSATVEFPGHALGPGLNAMTINKPPLADLAPSQTGDPKPGTQLRFGLLAPVNPTIHTAGTHVLIEFPKRKAVAEASKPPAEGPKPKADNSAQESAEKPPVVPSEKITREKQADERAKMMTRVEVQRGEREATIIINGDGQFTYDAKLVDKTRLVLDLLDVTTPLRQQVLPVDHPVLKQIRVGHYAQKVRLVFDMAKHVDYTIKPGSQTLTIRLTSLMSSQKHESPGAGANGGGTQRAGEPNSPVVPVNMSAAEHGTVRIAPASRVPFPERLARLEPTQTMAQMAPDLKSPASPPAVEPEEPVQQRFVGRRISLDFQAADISNVLRLIAEVSGFNIVVGESVKAKVTMKLVSVPWDQALDMLLKMNNLGKIREGNIIWIDTLANIARQKDEEARAKDAKIKAQDLQVETLYIRNVLAQDLQITLQRYVSARGQLNVNQAINALVVRDTPDNVAAFKRLVESLDLQSPQIQIEARIVQADTNYTRSLGVQWGVRNLTNLSGAGPNNVANFQSGNTGPFGGQVSDFLVNLPATPATGAAGMTIGRILGSGALLDMRLSAGEQLGLTKVLAAPKITTLHNREARITQGESIPFQTTSLQGTQTTFVDANLELQVTPQITSRDPKEQGKLILMRIRATRNAVGPASNPQAGPSILRREAQTQILVRDGETTVLGGIFVETTTTNVDAVPYVSRIPVLGWLFKRKTENVTKQELLIFLTPNIVST